MSANVIVESDPKPAATPAGVGWRATLAALSASLVGLGLARFAYAPLLPAIIAAHWFTPSAAAYLGAANLAGYLAGALLASSLAARFSARGVLRGMMAATTVALFASAWPVDFAWFFAWRFMSGIGGGTLMVLAAPTVLAHVTPARKGVVSGTIFAGVGLGIALSGTFVPLLLKVGVTSAWLGLGTASLLLTWLAWSGWPSGAPKAADLPTPDAELPRLQLRAIYAAYSLNAAGLVPHMIFLVDFVARGLHQGLAIGSRYWVIFGLGAIVGPVAGGYLADRIGFRNTLRLAFVVEAVSVALPAFDAGTPALIVSSAVVGAFAPGIVPLVLGRTQELLHMHPAAQKVAWSRATTGFATFQAASAYGMSYLLSRSGGDCSSLFLLGAVFMLLALAIDVAAGAVRPIVRKQS